MVSMFLHKYLWLMSCLRVSSVATSLHILLKNRVLGHRICNTLTRNATDCWSNCFCWDSQFNMTQPYFKVIDKAFALLSTPQKSDVSLLIKIQRSPLSHFTTNILYFSGIFFLEGKMKSNKKCLCQILSFTMSHAILITQQYP